MRFIAIFGVSLVCAVASAELPAGSTTIKPFDESVFDLPTMRTQDKAVKIGDRNASDDDGSYKRPDWVKSCESLKETKGMEAFRNCFDAKKNESSRELKSQQEKIETDQAKPYKNANPMVPDMENRGEGFGGVDSSSEKD